MYAIKGFLRNVIWKPIIEITPMKNLILVMYAINIFQRNEF
ncbi:unnamed protein product [Larinioides sclopetarius]|uniref:Uncharacterized protein n=1 Tax=Larinioides sclopetarius TaxID=280406 RepID=A0AAV2B667_9ARAC